jgi:hypothetical protein
MISDMPLDMKPILSSGLKIGFHVRRLIFDAFQFSCMTSKFLGVKGRKAGSLRRLTSSSTFSFATQELFEHQE